MDGGRGLDAGRPTLSVLPFACDGGGAQDRLIAEGLQADICSELTRFRALRVISPGSAAVVAEAPDHEIAARLRASHVLRGRLRRLGERLQLAAVLSETHGATQVWSDRIEVPEEDVLVLESDVVARIAAALNTRLERAALAEAQTRPTAMAASTLTLEGFARLREGTIEADEAARALFERALAIDPLHTRAHAGIALSWFNEWSCQFWDRFEQNARNAYECAHRALALDDRDALLHQVIGKLHLFRRDFERASWYFDRALALCPNDAELLIGQAIYETYLGRPEIGIDHAERAMRLNPYHPPYYFGACAIVHLVAGDARTALDLAARSEPTGAVDVPAYWAAAYAQLGRLDEARRSFANYRALFRDKILFGREPETDELVRWFADYNPFRRPEHLEIFLAAFRTIDAHLPAPEALAAGGAVLKRHDGGWAAEYEGRLALLPDLKGLADLRHLLERPGSEVHCLDLAGRDQHDPGEATLDDQARGALKTHIRDLQEELAEAEDHNDIGRAQHLREELDAVVETLSSALGLGGRRRRLGDLAERARSTVTWRIRHALRRVDAAHPELGRHLANSVRTGTFCIYRPEKPVTWIVD